MVGGGRPERNEYSLNFSCPFLWCEMNLRKYVISRFRRDVDDVLSWAIKQRVAVIPYERFGIIYRCHLQGTRCDRKIIGDPRDCSETSVINHRYSLRHNPEGRSSP